MTEESLREREAAEAYSRFCLFLDERLNSKDFKDAQELLDNVIQTQIKLEDSIKSEDSICLDMKITAPWRNS